MIRTVEELEAVPVGETVTVNDHATQVEWHRVDKGWLLKGRPETAYTVPSDTFAGAIQQGFVYKIPPVQPGQVRTLATYSDHRYRTLVLDVDQDAETAAVLVMRYTTVREFQPAMPFAELLRQQEVEADPPAWVEGAQAVGRTLLAQHQRLTRAARVEVQVLVYGSVAIPVDNTLLREVLHDDAAYLRNESSQVQWRKDVTVTRTGVTDCQCSTVTADDVRASVPEPAQRDWAYSVRGCSAH